MDRHWTDTGAGGTKGWGQGPSTGGKRNGSVPVDRHNSGSHRPHAVLSSTAHHPNGEGKVIERHVRRNARGGQKSNAYKFNGLIERFTRSVHHPSLIVTSGRRVDQASGGSGAATATQ